MTLTKATIKNRVLTRLGFPTVDIEVEDLASDSFWDNAIADALDTYSIHFPFVRSQTNNIEASDESFQLSYPTTALLEVIPEKTTFERLPYITALYGELANVVEHYAIIEAEMELMQDILGLLFTFELQDDQETVLITPIPQHNFMVKTKYGIKRELKQVRPVHEKWFIDYVEALTMVTLGRVRGKYKGIETPMGTLTLDGDEMLTQGNEKKKELEEALVNTSYEWIADFVDPIG